MKIGTFTVALLLLLLTAACLDRPKAKPAPELPPTAQGDSTLYGLVCDGSNDTILVFLRDPYDGSDPDTLHILDATRAHRVFGSLRIGDKVAMMRSQADSTKADIVIVTQDLLGQWCYRVKPRLRRRADISDDDAGLLYAQLNDSLRQLLQSEQEFGFTIKIDSAAQPIGRRAVSAMGADEERLVELPPLKRYRQWCIRNGQLLLTEMTVDSLGNRVSLSTDTADFVSLTPDSLILRFPDSLHHYYRKVE
jgi:hypothetical protein